MSALRLALPYFPLVGKVLLAVVTGPIHGRFRLPQPMPDPHPPRHRPVLAACHLGQVTIIGDLYFVKAD